MRLRPHVIADTAVVVVSMAFLATYFPLELVLDPSTPTGGDIPGHIYLAGYLQQELLSRGELFGWAPGWWAGFPMFQFYMIIPYLLMSALGVIMPLEVAFKLVCALSIVSLPASVYFGMKWSGSKRPAPAISAALTIPFLFVKTHNIWGMNIYSMLSGEIANAVGLNFMLLFWGLFHRSIREERISIWCPLLLALTILTHPTTALFALFSSLWAFFYLRRRNAMKWLGICLQTFGLSFLLVAFWAIPLIFKLEYTVGFGEDWTISLFGSFPGYAWIFAGGAVLGVASGILRKRPHIGYLTLGLVSSLVLFEFGMHFNLVNIRFWGFIYLTLILLAAEGFGFLLEKIKGGHLVPILVLTLTCFSFSPGKTVADEWVRWNFRGFENKAGWKAYQNIAKTLIHTKGRLAYDLHDDNNVYFGSVRAFEAIPHFIEKDIIEGGIIQSGISSLFTMHLQGEFSPTTAGLPRIVKAGRYDLKAATRHLELFNVKHLILRHERSRTDLRTSSEWRHMGDPGPYHSLFELVSHNGRYVYVPKHYPIPVHSKNWKLTAVDWFYDSRNIDFPLVFVNEKASKDERLLPVQDPETVQDYLFQKHGGDPSSMIHWLVLGPFPNPIDRSKDFWDLASTDPFGRDEEWIALFRPRLGDKTLGKSWKKLSGSSEYIDLKQRYPKESSALAYACAYVLAPEECDVMMRYGSDDGIKIWLNGETLVENRGHRPWRKDEFSVPARLKKGENIVILKCENAGGNWGLNLRVTDAKNRPIPRLSFRTGPGNAPEKRLRPILTGADADSPVTREDVSKTEIRFHTEGPGLPHIIKVSYFPNWHVEGADRVYMVSPCFLLVYPEEKDVRLYYGSTPSDRIGKALTLLGLILLGVHMIVPLCRHGRRKT
jgi:hypothetical protein